jgi:hypothetical protein
MRLVLVLFSAVLLILSMALAARVELWHDEIFTLNLASVPSVSDIWSALATGTDLNPPLFYLLTRASQYLFGSGVVATRLPSAIGFCIMCLCLYRFAVRWFSPPYACATMLFPLVTGAYAYAIEARPYGLLLGCCGLALMFWQEAIEGPWRRNALIGLVLSIAAAVSCHYYAVFALLPLAAGEVTRSYLRRKLDTLVWLALAAGVCPLVFYLPLMNQAASYISVYWSRPGLTKIPEFYIFLLRDAVPSLVVLLILTELLRRVSWRPAVTEPDANLSYSLPSPQLTAVIGFAALPVVMVILTRVTTRSFAERFALPAVIGLSLLITIVVYRYERGWVGGGVLMALVFTGWFLTEFGLLITGGAISPHRGIESRILGAGHPPIPAFATREDLPILIPQQHLYVEMVQSLPRSAAERLTFLRPDNEDRRDIRGLGMWTQLPLDQMDLTSVLDAHERFFLYRSLATRGGDWVIPALVKRGAQVEVVAESGPYFLFLVQCKHPRLDDGNTSERAISR